MKTIIKIVIIVQCIFTIAHAQTLKEFILIGTVQGLKDGTKIFLVVNSDRSGEIDTVSFAESNQSRFILKGHVKGEANFYFLKLDSASSNKKVVSSNALWLVNDKMNVIGNLTEWNNLNLINSEPHAHWLEYKDLQAKNSRQPEWGDIKMEFVRKHLSSLFTPFVLQNLSPNDQEDAYAILTDEAKNSFFGKKVSALIKQNKIVSLANVSGKIPDFRITSADGKQLSIHSIAAQSKYTLIDFWASWCSPCRSAIPKMKKVYEAFKGKGFNIVGISTDNNETSWRRALQQDGTSWDHGIDNIDKAGKNIFPLAAIPAYLLIDHEGKIIQTDYFLSGQGSIMINKPGEKTLSGDLYEVIKGLLGEGKGK